MNAGHAFMMFLLAGVIPGTSTALSAEVMMEGFALLIGFVMARVSARFILQLSERFSLRIRSRA